MKPNIKKVGKRNRSVRLWILLFVLILTTAVGLMHQFGKSFTTASIDSFCPFGALESLYLFVTDGNMLKRTNFNDFILLGIVVSLALVFRRTFCGNLCPLGTLQELFSKGGIKITKKRYEIPLKIDKPLRYLKYAVLVVFIAATWRIGDLVIRPYDPWVAYHHLLSDDLIAEFSAALVILAISLAGSFFYDRFFCKYLCPMGAFLGIVGKIGFFRVRRNETTCIDCKLCTKVCPVNIKVHEISDVRSSECLNCNECVNVCPVESTLTISGSRKGRIGSLSFTVITFVAMLAVVGITSVSGSFTWLMPSLGYSADLEKFNPDDIRGKYTFKEISEATGIPEEVIIKEFGLTHEKFLLPIKETGIEAETVRDYIKKMKE